MLGSEMDSGLSPPSCPGMTADELFIDPSTIFATISRWISDEPPKIV